MAKLRMNQAIARAIGDEMREDPSVIVLGEDIAHAEGPFKTSEGLLAEFGETRVRDTPISEMGFLGAAVGAAMTGLRPVVEIMFIEFLGVALDQLSTGAAKMRFLSGGRLEVPLVVRASVGSGAGFGCQHSQTLETWLMGTPGLKVCVASGARSAYGLVRSAIRDNDPVVLLEPRVLYGRREEFEPGPDALVPIGVAETLRTGDDVTVVTLGQTVGIATEAAEAAGFSAEVIDLRTLYPWDRDHVIESVSRTGRLVVVEESPASGGWGADVVDAVSRQAFGALVAPPLRITTPDAPVPFPISLEREYLPSSSYVRSQIAHLLDHDEAPAPWWMEVTR